MQFPKANRVDKKEAQSLIKIYKEQNAMCAVCLFRGENSFTDHIHHILPSISNMKIEHVSNYIPICFRHHVEIHELRRLELIQAGMEIKIWFEIKKAKGEIQ